MTKAKFTGYGVDCSGGYNASVPGMAMDHAFVTSDAGDEWRCWGRGKETIGNGARQLVGGEGVGYAEWARQVYGDPSYPTGLFQYVDGVCQHASNRLLALAGTDVSAASGNIAATVLYGKFGYRLGDFRVKVQQAGRSLQIPEPEIEAVMDRFGDTASDLAVLECHFQGLLPSNITAEQNGGLLAVYRNFQSERDSIHSGMLANRGSDDGAFQKRFGLAIAPMFFKCLNDFCDILGPESHAAVFGMLPQQTMTYLSPFLLKTL